MTLPDVINHQDFLLTLDTSTLPVVKDALPGVDIYPLFLDAENGLWVLRAQFHPGVTLPMHFHTGTVHFYTLSGCWYYLEYPDQKPTAIPANIAAPRVVVSTVFGRMAGTARRSA